MRRSSISETAKADCPFIASRTISLTMCGRCQSMVLFVWRIAGRNEEDTIQLHGVACLSGDGEMAAMDRIEGSAEKSQTHNRRSHCEPAGKLRMKAIISRE